MNPPLIAREEAKAAILKYIQGALSQDECYWESASRLKKCAILTTAGIKGTGKTRVLHEMCTTWLHETPAKAALTVDFNGGSYWDHRKAVTEVFSKLLLQQSGMPAGKAEDCASILPWTQVMQCLREKLNLGNEDLLLVGIDEIRQLETLAGKSKAVQLISDLMGAQDECSKRSGKLPRNPLEWHQLQQDIVASSKLGDRKALDSGEVTRWYSPLHSTTPSELEDLCLRGIVHSVRCGDSWINILHPVVLQLWARSAGTSLAEQIKQMFEQDVIMEATSEKKFEDIMVHFDCAVRLALRENNCTLGLLFPGASFWPERVGLPNVIVTSTQNDLAPLEYVESFADVGAVLDSLKNGKIVVSTLRNEPGIEYLIPWMVPSQEDRRRIRDLKPDSNKNESASLLVLGIQTKCVVHYVPKWTSVAKSAQDALAGFQNHPDVLGALPVFYTTEVRVVTPPDQLKIPSIYFNEVGLAKLLLQRTGPLRLFFLKPGEPLKKMLPDFFESKTSALHA
ncbi:unnamed protein product [Symbiodinium sp. KB8]|nr:unnamed protein product [Symbiodinium sp. KB8]